jgi:hypothetical protein
MLGLRGGIAVTLVASATALFAGCGGQSDRDAVTAKVNQFLKATAGKDYRTLCEQILAPSLVARLKAGGIQCEQAMKISLANVKSPRLSIGRVDVHGAKASVITLTTAAGQEASIDAIELIKTGGGWRVAALGTPQVPAAKS